MGNKKHPDEGPETQISIGMTPELRARVDSYIDRHARDIRNRNAFYDRAAREMLEREEKGQMHG